MRCGSWLGNKSIKLHNYVASGTCPKPHQSSGCQGRRPEEIVVTTCYRSFLSLVGQKMLSDTSDYKVFRKAGKYKRGLRHSKADSDPWSGIWTWENLQSTDMILLRCHIDNLGIHQLGRSLHVPFIVLFSFRHAVGDQLYRIEMLGHIV